MPRITPFLWYHERAEEAAAFYVSLFPNSRILHTVHATEPIPGAHPGSVLTVEFELNGQRIVAMNGGPTFTLDEAFSLSVEVDTQEEVDRLWEALIADGGTPSQCGWLRDRWGLSWQITPAILNQLMADPERAARAAASMMTMGKIDIATLIAAVDGG
ncbi:VOC family protein [Cellulomonas sp. NPDC089187]|uniref:VOC family protein n=1 Tax=Cellulomonas sp. NPDC089187 TaxID=3154970 RepID=UPI00343E88A7